MNDIMKIAKSLEESVFLLKCVNETIKIEAKEQKGRFLGMFFWNFLYYFIRKPINRERHNYGS